MAIIQKGEKIRITRIPYIMSTEQTAFFPHQTTNKKGVQKPLELSQVQQQNGHSKTMTSGFFQSCHNHSQSTFLLSQAELPFYLHSIALILIILFLSRSSFFRGRPKAGPDRRILCDAQ